MENKKIFSIQEYNEFVMDNFLFHDIKKIIENNIYFENDEVSVKIKNYHVVKPNLDDESIVNNAKSNLQTLNTQIKGVLSIHLKSKDDVFEKEINIMDVPLMIDGGKFIINGYERVFVLQLMRNRGIFLNKQENKYTISISPEHGNIFQISKGIQNKKESIYISIGTNKIAFIFFITALFYNNIDEFLYEISHNISNFKIFNASYDSEKYIFVAKYEYRNNIKFLSDNTDFSENVSGFVIDKKYLPILQNVKTDVYYKKNCCDEVMGYVRNTINNESIDFVHKNFLDEKFFSLGKLGRQVINAILYNNQDNKHFSNVLTKDDLVRCLHLLLEQNETFFVSNYNDNDLSFKYLRSIGKVLYYELLTTFYTIHKLIYDKLSIKIDNIQKAEQILTQVQEIISNKVINKKILNIFTQNPCSQFLNQLNPLAEVLHKIKVTSIGSEGLSKEFASYHTRNLHASFYGRLCCLSTPEGQNVGLVNYICQHAKIDEMGFINTPFYQVINGKVQKKIIYVDAFQEKINNYIIAPYNTKVDNENNILDEYVICRQLNNNIKTHKNDINLVEIYNNQFISLGASLIPFLEYNDNTRANMASSMQRQTLPLIFPEYPQVLSGSEEYIAKHSKVVIRSRVNGIVTYVDSQCVSVTDEQQNVHKHTFNFLQKSNQNTNLGHRPLAQIGQNVKINDILADSSCTINGTLSLGTNLLVAIMPFKGYNYEDAVVLSDSCVKNNKLSSIIISEYDISCKKTSKGDEIITKNIPGIVNKLSHLDNNGIVKIGSTVEDGDILVGRLTPIVNRYTSKLEERFDKKIFGQKIVDYKNTSLKMPRNKSGVVIDVMICDNTKDTSYKKDNELLYIKVYVAHKSNIQEGDKICGRYGNKTVVSKILPKSDMPYTKSGKTVDMIINPLGIISRMNIGQIMEINVTKTLKNNETINAMPYSWSCDMIAKRLENEGFRRDGKEQLFDGITGEPFEKEVVVGNMYTLRLEHMVENKVHSRSIGKYLLITRQPVSGKAHGGGQRCGEMETWTLEAHGASNTLMEKLIPLSDDLENKEKLIRSIIKDVGEYSFGTPSTFNVLVKYLNSLYIKFSAKNKKSLLSNKNTISELELQNNTTEEKNT